MSERGKDADDQRTNVVALDPRAGRPEPPRELNADQAEEWRRLVGCMPRNWMRPQSFSTLAAYCRHSDQANMLSRQIRALQARAFDTDKATIRFIRLTKAAEREARMVLACARALKILPRRPR